MVIPECSAGAAELVSRVESQNLPAPHALNRDSLSLPPRMKQRGLLSWGALERNLDAQGELV